MTLFQYTAVNTDGKEVTGSLDAPTVDAAKSALESMHFEIVEVHEASRAHRDAAPMPLRKPSTMKSFAFEGTGAGGVTKRGTIQADNKFDAFSKLIHGQNMHVTMLSPVGVTPQFRDNDLENWQKKTSPAAAPKSTPAATVAAPPRVASKTPLVQKSLSAKPTPAAALERPTPTTAPREEHHYLPILETLRLYAGWLFAWYGLFVAIGYYVTERAIPFNIPFVQGFYLSPLIFTFTVAIFLFLLLTTLHRALHGGMVKGMFLTLVGIISLFVVRLSIV